MWKLPRPILVFCIFFLKILDGIIPLLIIVEILDLEDLFAFLLNDVGVSTYCKRVMATNLLTSLVPRTSVVVLVFLASLVLVSKKLLMLTTRYVSKRSVSELRFFRVFFLPLCGCVSLETLQINLSGP